VEIQARKPIALLVGRRWNPEGIPPIPLAISMSRRIRILDGVKGQGSCSSIATHGASRRIGQLFYCPGIGFAAGLVTPIWPTNRVELAYPAAHRVPICMGCVCSLRTMPEIYPHHVPSQKRRPSGGEGYLVVPRGAEAVAAEPSDPPLAPPPPICATPPNAI
jgi:hypothetical protein